MARLGPKLSKDHEEIALKFKELIDKADAANREREEHEFPLDTYFALRVSAINLLTRLASDDSIYVQELKGMWERKEVSPSIIKGILEAARTDYLQGYMADHSLLISAEVFSDLLVQAEVLQEHDYKDAAAVLIRAVLEDGIRRLCAANRIEVGKRDTLHQLNENLTPPRAQPSSNFCTSALTFQI